MARKLDVQDAVDVALEARQELERRGVAANEALVMTGLALGVLLSGGSS
jgi:hypothetical protein